MAELIAPTTRLHASWVSAHAEWGPGPHEDGFGLLAGDEPVSPAGFSAWVKRLRADAAGGDPAGSGCVHRWIVDGDDVLGGIALRYGDRDLISRAGHIGYGIRPSARRRGLATWALGQMLVEQARPLGIDPVLVVCAADNLASAATIERNGGVLEGIEPTAHGPVRRYWISTG